MYFLTEKALIQCGHMGVVRIKATQSFVTINNAKVLVAKDPERRIIVGCPIAAPAGKPCLLTLSAHKGYSTFLRINNRQICLDTITGFTDGVPPGVVHYKVTSSGQRFVSEK